MRRLFATTAAAPPGALQLLVSHLGPRAPTTTPAVHAGTTPLPVSVRRPWTSLRGTTPKGTRLTPGWSTLLEVTAPARPSTLRVALGDTTTDVRAAPLPSALAAPGASFNVLLVSCYHRDEDTGFRVAEEARRLARDEGVHLVLHLGDQVYLDLPTRQNLPKDEVALADALEQKYRDNFVP
ncbi:MAG: hypothetical protein SFW67_15235, partial [Myxococcaceae bacterium]|nr:hypothetical protein [Myxococcaceae bacterium]